MWKKSKHNKGVLRLMRQIKQAKLEEKEYGVKPLRPRAYRGTIHDEIWWDLPYRTIQKSWKKHRKTQYGVVRGS